ncbi:hypothetical protein JK358_00500 [Nocardia sp. 2]|uniref:Outer membrane channel protein CpnT-like N-terminal domain-containing protein n=1 Tax=Nocardia acididurans TaxID=2802282 RepID=A0ABS1LX48_9NOCA|nr:hypothetical protein [Nocardia acididurans]MBL1072868.1 hypothetical protein [Nocardia acididurans]
MTLWFPDLPGPLGFLADFLVGHWPEGDEDAMRRAAGHWADMADALEQLQDPANQAMLAAQTNIDGRISVAMASFWAQTAGGENSELHKLITLCRSYEGQLKQGATDIEYTKLTIYGSILVIAAMAFTPVGAVVDMVALNAVRFAIRMAVQKLIAKLGVRGAAFALERATLWSTVKMGEKVVDQTIAQTIVKQALIGAGIGGGLDAGVQGIQLASNGRENFNVGSLFLSTGAGAVAGSIAGTLGERVAVGLAPGLTNSSGLTQVATVGAAQIPGNLLGNAAAATAIGITTDRPIDLTAVSHGVGGGFIGKPVAAHGDSVIDAASQAGPVKDSGGAASDGAQPAAGPHPDAGDTVSVAATAPIAEAAPTTTVAANHGNQVVAQPDSVQAPQPGSSAPGSSAPAAAAPVSASPAGPAPASAAPAGAAPVTAAPAGATLSGGNPATSQPGATVVDRGPASAPGTSTHGNASPIADRQVPTAPARTLPDTSTRPETQAPVNNRAETPPRTEAPQANPRPAADRAPEPSTDRMPEPAAPEHDPRQPADSEQPGNEPHLENAPATGPVTHDPGVPGQHRAVPDDPELAPTPKKLTSNYLNEVLEGHNANPFNRANYESIEPQPFRAGSPDAELPSTLTRSMPEHALNEAVSPIDPDKIVVNYDGDGLVPMWRDQSPDDAYLASNNALFRMDSRGPEMFGGGFAPRDPSNLNIGAHVGNATKDGFVSLSRSPEHTILRDQHQVSGETLARMADAGEVERLPGGGYRQTRFMHEFPESTFMRRWVVGPVGVRWVCRGFWCASRPR